MEEQSKNDDDDDDNIFMYLFDKRLKHNICDELIFNSNRNMANTKVTFNYEQENPIQRATNYTV